MKEKSDVEVCTICAIEFEKAIEFICHIEEDEGHAEKCKKFTEIKESDLDELI